MIVELMDTEAGNRKGGPGYKHWNEYPKTGCGAGWATISTS